MSGILNNFSIDIDAIFSSNSKQLKRYLTAIKADKEA